MTKGPLRGDKLASGEARATFLGPMLKFDETEMRRDLTTLPKALFCEKYLVAEREYEMMTTWEHSEEVVNSFAEQMRKQAEFYQRGLDADAQQAASLRRECFLEPFGLHIQGYAGRVIVDRDEPATPKGDKGRLLIPRSLRKEKTLLPTTGHIIKAFVLAPDNSDFSPYMIGKRILFNQMSGSPICFSGYPTWTLLELAEIMCWVPDPEVRVVEEALEPMV